MRKWHVPEENFNYEPSSPHVQKVPELSGDDDLLLTLEGETFAVRATLHDSVHYAWVSGPNNGYEFSALCTQLALTDRQHEAVIGEFLEGINPATGFLQDKIHPAPSISGYWPVPSCADLSRELLWRKSYEASRDH